MAGKVGYVPLVLWFEEVGDLGRVAACPGVMVLTARKEVVAPRILDIAVQVGV